MDLLGSKHVAADSLDNRLQQPDCLANRKRLALTVLQ
jgi:hypothetical protein